jgi:DNA-binding CsgD family transcriptional regulator
VAEGRAQVRAAVELALRIRHQLQLLVCMLIGAELCAADGRWADVVTLFAAHRAASAAKGSVGEAAYNGVRQEELLRRAALELPPAELRRAEDRGTVMRLETAAELVLVATAEDPDPPPAAMGAPLAMTALPVLAAAPPLTPAVAAHEAVQNGAGLSQREQELLALVAGGLTDAEIAGRLYISVNTVRSHLDRIREKTGSRRRADLTRLALRVGAA